MLRLSFESSSIGRSALILLALRSVSPFRGRIKVQKILYLANLCGWNCIRDYHYYNYGPYADSITTELEIFKRNGWILEESFETDQGNTAHSYLITRQGQKIADSLAAKLDNPKLVQKTTNLMKDLYNFKSDDLEMMATLVFLRRNEPGLSDDALVKRVTELKQRFEEADVKKNMRIFNILRDFGYDATRPSTRIVSNA
jgi:uncharacterized protein YwgA